MKRELSTEVEEAIGKRIRSKSPGASNDIPPSKAQSTPRTTNDDDKRKTKNAARALRKQRKKIESIDPGSHDDVFWKEVALLLGEDIVDTALEDGTDMESPYNLFDEIDLTISRMSSNGASSNT